MSGVRLQSDTYGSVWTTTSATPGRAARIRSSTSLASSWAAASVVSPGRPSVTSTTSPSSVSSARTVRGDRRMAEVALGRLLGEIDDGQHAVRAGTVGELCERWYSHAAPDLSPAVAAEYRRLSL